MLADEQGIKIIFLAIGANKAGNQSLNRFPKFTRIEILIKWTLFVHNEEGGRAHPVLWQHLSSMT